MKNVTKLVCALMAVLLFFYAFHFEGAAADPIESSKLFMAEIENELREESTDVISELEELVLHYSNLIATTSEYDTIEKLQALISTTYELIDDYKEYQNLDRGSFHIIYSAEVAAVIAAFNALGYDLAAELLTQAKNNNILDSYYSPVLGSDVTVSSVFTSIQNGTVNSGSSAFPNSGTTDEKDLYYAIHAFNYRKSDSGRVVIIEDRYDYAQGAMGGSLTGMIVNEMYNAQVAGVIVPFYTYIVESTSNSPQDQFETVSIDSIPERRMFSENIVLGSSEYKEISMTFDTSGYRIFQTFGTLDTKIELFNSQGNSLSNGTGDDNGYGMNSLLRYYCVAGTTYKVKIRFFGSLTAGEFIFSVTPANGVVNSGTSSIVTYDDIWAVTGFVGYTFNTWTVLNQTKCITFSAPSDGTYTFEIISDYDTYLYVIDPQSFSTWKNGVDYDDDSGTNFNALISRELTAGIPYLVVYSSFNIQNSSSIGNVTVNITKEP